VGKCDKLWVFSLIKYQNTLSNKLQSRVGKTHMVGQLIKKQHFTKKIKSIYYFGCAGNEKGQLDWHTKLTDVAVHFNGNF
jgi:hypothetical protein